MLRAIRSVGLVLLVIVVAAVALLWIFQRNFIYPAPPPDKNVAAGYSPVILQTGDGLSLRAAYRPAAPGQPTIIFFHGNGDGLAGAALATGVLAAADYGVLLPEYRGYGGNPGHPDEAGLYADGEAALRFLRKSRVGDADIVLIGNSLGSGVATELAARHSVAGLVIVSGYTRLPDVVRDIARGLPIGWLVRDGFANIDKLPSISAPILVMHGQRDRVIAFAHGEALAAAAHTRLLAYPGAGHELAFRGDAQAAILAWLEEHRHADASQAKAKA